MYPADFLPCIAAAAGFELGPGDSTVAKARWPVALVPPPGTHVCWLATVLTRSDEPTAGRHVWEHNNLAQKNLTVVNLVPDAWFVLPFVLNRFRKRTPRPVVIELVRPKGLEKLEAELLQRSGTAFQVVVPDRQDRPSLSVPTEPRIPLDCGGGPPGTATHDAMWTSDTADALVAQQFDAAVEVAFEPGRVAQIPIAFRGIELLMGLRLHVPATSKPGEVLRMHLVQRDADTKRITGGLAVQVRVRGLNSA